MTLLADPPTVLDHTDTFAMTPPFAPALVPDDPTPAPLAELLTIAEAQRARLLSIAPTVLEVVHVDTNVNGPLVQLSRRLAEIVCVAAVVGLAIAPHDVQGEVFGTLLDLCFADVTHLIAAIGLDGCNPDRLTRLITLDPEDGAR